MIIDKNFLSKGGKVGLLGFF
uniref:Uncharacterized protein n=1 Tax=Physcomitrium patens TaxID=3218 RepID=A0A2K1JM65_PHYPA|nr:hypothetical protein PHYPA_017464 [Physcomitrium patens]